MNRYRCSKTCQTFIHQTDSFADLLNISPTKLLSFMVITVASLFSALQLFDSPMQNTLFYVT